MSGIRRAVNRGFVVAALVGSDAAAQETRLPPPGLLLPGIGTRDPREPVDQALSPWRALARVQTELGGRCTGAMVAPDRVLTAAHCLVAARTRRFVQPGSVHVLLGYDRGAWVARARVVRFVIGTGYSAERGTAAADWALLALDRPIATPDRILPLLIEAPPPGTPAMLGGYQQDRPEVVLADTGCRILGLQRHPSGHATLLHDCAGTRGASGAPLLARMQDGRNWGVAGVQSAVSAELALGHAVPASAISGVE